MPNVLIWPLCVYGLRLCLQPQRDTSARTDIIMQQVNHSVSTKVFVRHTARPLYTVAIKKTIQLHKEDDLHSSCELFHPMREKAIFAIGHAQAQPERCPGST